MATIITAIIAIIVGAAVGAFLMRRFMGAGRVAAAADAATRDARAAAAVAAQAASDAADNAIAAIESRAAERQPSPLPGDGAAAVADFLRGPGE